MRVIRKHALNEAFDHDGMTREKQVTLTTPDVREVGVSVFFFQAEDGIRDDLVTGVQTCALPISSYSPRGILDCRNLDGMEAVKMNVFHWHISDNQGFRAESKKLPKLTSLGSGGQYHLQEEIRDLIAYARDRGIRVVPEFDMPGHSSSWFVGYPDIASTPGPFKIDDAWGVMDPAVDPTNEKTYKFLDTFIGEMAKLFPHHYFHIGGDQLNGKSP